MADLAITAAQVLVTSDTVTASGTAGATITAGQPVYLDAADSKYKLADANASSTTAAAVGIALHASLDGQPIKIATGGDLTLGAGAAPAVGTTYVLSATAGGIAPNVDAASGWFKTILGVGKTGNILSMKVFASGQAIP